MKIAAVICGIIGVLALLFGAFLIGIIIVLLSCILWALSNRSSNTQTPGQSRPNTQEPTVIGSSTWPPAQSNRQAIQHPPSAKLPRPPAFPRLNWWNKRPPSPPRVKATLWIGALAVALVAGLVAIVIFADGSQPATESKPSPTRRIAQPAVPATPTLRQYWDLPACLDLLDRVDAATLAGMSDEQIVRGMATAEGAIKRYGVNEVLEHCTDVLERSNNRP